MEKYLFFNSIAGDRVYQAEDFATYFKNLITNGVLNYGNPNSLKITSNSTFEVVVSAGFGYIDGYLYHNDTPMYLNVDLPDAVLHRKDIVVLEKDLINRWMQVRVIKGTPSASPVLPTLTRNSNVYQMCLAEITINAGQASILSGNIWDTRSDTTKCGYAQSTLNDASGKVSKSGDTMTGDLNIKKDYPLMKFLTADGLHSMEMSWNANSTNQFEWRIKKDGVVIFSVDSTIGKIGTNEIIHKGNLKDVVQSGSANVIPVPDTPTKVSIVFAKAYSTAPIVTATPITTVPGTLVTGVSVHNITTTGFDIYLTRTSNLSTDICWIAVPKSQ